MPIKINRMKRIVVPIDFSENSMNALEQALSVAAMVDASVYIVYAYLAKRRADTMININKVLKEDAEAQLRAVVQNLSVPANVAVHTKALKGEPMDAVKKYVMKHDADLVVIGTQGEQSRPDVFIGRVAGKLIKLTNIPILLIPNQVKIAKIDNILFALKSMVIKHKEQLRPLKPFLKKFKASLQILHIQTPDLEPIERVESEEIKKLDSPIESIEAENIYQGLSAYLPKSNADLVCVMRRRRRFLELLFTRKRTRKNTFESALPLLILQGHF